MPAVTFTVSAKESVERDREIAMARLERANIRDS
jgi:hypothetical protein